MSKRRRPDEGVGGTGAVGAVGGSGAAAAAAPAAPAAATPAPAARAPAAPSAGLSLRDRVILAMERAGGTSSSQQLRTALPSVSLVDIAGVLQTLMAERRVEAYAARLPPGVPRTAANEEHTYKLVAADKAARMKVRAAAA